MESYCFRPAQPGDRDGLLDLIEAGFGSQTAKFDPQTGMEHRTLFSYLYSLPGHDFHRIMLATDDDSTLAAAGALPQQLWMGEVPVPVWAISPVVTAPGERGKGLAGQCLIRLLAHLKDGNIPAVFLWGIPGFYPKFGFVPILPRFKTKISHEQLHPGFPKIQGELRPFAAEDLPEIAALYDLGNQIYWLQPRRNMDWWQGRAAEMNTPQGYIKEVPFPVSDHFLVWENQAREVSGYMYYETEPTHRRLVVLEGAALDPETAMMMLVRFIHLYLPPGQSLLIRGTPNHVLNLAAYRLGGIHQNPAPLAGMIKVLDWQRLLGFLKPLIDRRGSGFEKLNCTWQFRIGDAIIKLVWSGSGFDWELVPTGAESGLFGNEIQLTRLVFGLYDRMDLPEFNTETLTRLFPLQAPFIWDNNYLY
ncbi:MAG TPA: GNAT family N-acetyltransferase [Bacillota bacterium]